LAEPHFALIFNTSPAVYSFATFVGTFTSPFFSLIACRTDYPIANKGKERVEPDMKNLVFKMVDGFLTEGKISFKKSDTKKKGSSTASLFKC